MKNRQTKSKLAQLSVQTFFFIFMGILMSAIIMYGIQKIFFVQDTLNEQDRVLIEKEIKQTFEYCQDPLNKGNFKKINLDNNLFNSVCVSGGDNFDFILNSNLEDELNQIKSTGDNIILIDSTTNKDGEILEYSIINSFKIEEGIIDKNICYFPDYKGEINFKVICN